MLYIDQALSKPWKRCCDITALDRYSCDITQKRRFILTIETAGCDVTGVFSQSELIIIIIIIIIICYFNSSSSCINIIVKVVVNVVGNSLVLCAGSSVGVLMTN
jgi:hypothetical protein